MAGPSVYMHKAGSPAYSVTTMFVRPVKFLGTLLVFLKTASGFAFLSFSCRGCSTRQALYFAPHAVGAPTVPTDSATARAKLHRIATPTAPLLLTRVPSARCTTSTRLPLKREELSEETLRDLTAADQRVKDLEEEYWKSLDEKEKAIERKCSTGLAYLKMMMLEKAAEDYTAAAELRYPGVIY